MAQHNHTIRIAAKSELEALKKLEALQTLAENITAENLKLLADKSKTVGINAKIQLFKSYI